MSKAVINYLTQLIAVHEAKNRIRYNAALPGMTATKAVKKPVRGIPVCGNLANKTNRR